MNAKVGDRVISEIQDGTLNFGDVGTVIASKRYLGCDTRPRDTCKEFEFR